MHVCVCVCVRASVFIKLHITMQSGPVINSSYATVLHVTHLCLGVTFREHILGWKCACIHVCMCVSVCVCIY